VSSSSLQIKSDVSASSGAVNTKYNFNIFVSSRPAKNDVEPSLCWHLLLHFEFLRIDNGNLIFESVLSWWSFFMSKIPFLYLTTLWWRYDTSSVIPGSLLAFGLSTEMFLEISQQ
jgi:hypothetical protein